MGMLSVCRTGRKNMGWEREKTNIFTQRAPLPNLPRTPQNMPHSRDSWHFQQSSLVEKFLFPWESLKPRTLLGQGCWVKHCVVLFWHSRNLSPKILERKQNLVKLYVLPGCSRTFPVCIIQYTFLNDYPSSILEIALLALKEWMDNFRSPWLEASIPAL